MQALTTQEYNSIMSQYKVKTTLSQNAKMKKSSQSGIHLYNFGIVAYKSQDGTFTCPNALQCVSGCYARQGAYAWSNTNLAYEARYKLTKDPNFNKIIIYNIDRLLKNKAGTILIRIHDSGDFYSKEYLTKWIDIMQHYKSETRVMFYAYTKMIQLFKDSSALLPSNFRYIFSYGGKQDKLIDSNIDRHAKVFQSETELNDQGYHNSTSDDKDALRLDTVKIGLVYHGTKGYKKTKWSSVS